MIRRAHPITMIAAPCRLGLPRCDGQCRSRSQRHLEMEVHAQDGQEMELSVKLKAEGEKLTGQLILPMGDKIEIEKGAFKDDEVKFETTFKRNGNTFKTKYKGKVEGDTIKGKTERERNGEVVMRDWEAKREKK